LFFLEGKAIRKAAYGKKISRAYRRGAAAVSDTVKGCELKRRRAKK